ncbi:unnamed protein product [Enterobius vermicularis]|uniref:SAYSvFN domain-containing protein n=1 Tax=Enterobius vermicularis TaxID=51028 RepID=A0A0N4V7Z7_ENTVE|nr:unnamed protein product [Enterobius vermicularis]
MRWPRRRRFKKPESEYYRIRYVTEDVKLSTLKALGRKAFKQSIVVEEKIDGNEYLEEFRRLDRIAKGKYDYIANASLKEEILQVQLFFWTIFFAGLYVYVWQQNGRKFAVTLLTIVPLAFYVAFIASFWLIVAVLIGHWFGVAQNTSGFRRYGQDPAIEQFPYRVIRPSRKRSSSSESSLGADIVAIKMPAPEKLQG